MFFRLVDAALVLALAAAAGVAAGSPCSSTAAARLAVTTSYNASGHWLATLRLERDTALPGRPAVMLLDVRPSATRCGNTRTDALVVTLQGPPPPPGAGFDEVPGVGYYKVHPEQLSWEEAKVACEAEDAHLLILNSESEAAAVQQLIKLHPNVNSWVHVGFHDKGKEGHYVTIFGEPLAATGFTRWSAGQPDNAGNNENCGSVHMTTMGLNDLPCTTYRTPFVCEQFM